MNLIVQFKTKEIKYEMLSICRVVWEKTPLQTVRVTAEVAQNFTHIEKKADLSMSGRVICTTWNISLG